MIERALINLASAKTCQQCARQFDCTGCSASASGSSITACWCMDYPAIFSCAPANQMDNHATLTAHACASSGLDCLCPNCLTLKTQLHIRTYIDTTAVHQHAPAQALACEGLPLIEGLDYVIEQGRWVLSRWYLLKRGTCCGNACRNCPYGHSNVA